MDVLSFIQILFSNKEPNEYVEIRLKLPDGAWKQVFFNGEVDKVAEEINAHIPEWLAQGADIYFGVCPRVRPSGTNKDVERGLVFWADIDTYDSKDPQQAFDSWFKKLAVPPHVVVRSGHGFHAYWRVFPYNDFKRLSEVGTAVMRVLGGVELNDAARILRLPGTLNFKDRQAPMPVSVFYTSPMLTPIRLDDIERATQVSSSIIDCIHTGGLLDKPSRSERDFLVIRALYSCGVSKETIKYIFDTLPVGDRHREDEEATREGRYFDLTYKKVASSTLVIKTSTGETKSLSLPVELEQSHQEDSNGHQVLDASWGILEIQGSYFALSSKDDLSQLSTFVLIPKMLLTSLDEEDGEDILLCDVRSDGRVWKDVPFPKSSFDRVDSLQKHLKKLQWQWFGQDRQVRKLLPYLLNKLKTSHKGQTVEKYATAVIGRHEVAGKTYFVAEDVTLGPDDGVVWANLSKEHPPIRLSQLDGDDEEIRFTLEEFVQLLPELNEPHVIWLSLGWTVASLLKPVVEQCGWRFPMLNLYGTRGAGKTTLITRILQPLVGYETPTVYDSDTTAFVMRVLFGSTNCVPVSFGEHRQYSLSGNRLIRNILLAYDGGKDSRGTTQQTTVQYKLTAPVTVDGEDPVTDPASLERVVQIAMRPETIREGGICYNAFQRLSLVDLRVLSRPIISFSLTLHKGDVEELLGQALRLCREAVRETIPDRVRRNLATCLFGLEVFRMFCHSLGVDVVLPEDLRSILLPALLNVINLETGRTRLLVDDLVEDVVRESYLNPSHNNFSWWYDAESGVFYFNLTSAYRWWQVKRRQQGETFLNLTAIKAQMRERMSSSGLDSHSGGQYVTFIGAKTIRGASIWCHGVDLALAQSILDVPDQVTNPISELFLVNINSRREET
ncbi:MAG: hypothetical protein QXS68_03030 [Candidatus Methanomethylicaceae archaeon]